MVILDFQSLYPSLMIAYNICYSTCLGPIEEKFNEKGEKRMGVNKVNNIDFKALFGDGDDVTEEKLLKKVIVTPNKVAYIRKDVRLGILPKVLQEFLNTRIMLKKSLKHVRVKRILLIMRL